MNHQDVGWTAAGDRKAILQRDDGGTPTLFGRPVGAGAIHENMAHQP